jgi:NAD(P)-dependent dehydrogenase (short-subunit alcohol dehydrogenase family)
MAQRLLEKRCLIVGGTTGMGFVAARRFLEEGARVVVAGRDEDKGRAAQRELAPLGNVHFFACDASVEDSVERLVDAARTALGGLDSLYHVAGMSGRRFGDGPLHACTAAGWDATLDANLKGAFLSNRAAVRGWLAEKQPGAILNMASVLGFSPSPHFFDTYAYSAAKGAVIAMSRQAAARYAPEGIRVNVIAPSLIDTPMAARSVGDAGILAFMRTKQPLTKAPGRPEDCADAAVFLCSDEARFITGVVLPVDGGWCVSEGQHASAP